jgi:hypothetical protein
MVTQLTNAAQQAHLTSDKTSGSPSMTSSPQLGGETSNVSGLKALMKLSGMGSRDSANSDRQTSVISLDPQDGTLKLEVAERLLKWHAEALGRMVDLSPTADVSVTALWPF